MSRVLSTAGCVAGLVLLGAGCMSTAGPDRPAVPAPAHPANTTRLLTTEHPVTVIDNGSGAELCLALVLTSYPPQCDGPKLAGWDWTGKFVQASGTRWGEFIVTGHYDQASETFTPTDVRSGEGYVWPTFDDDTWASACPEPTDGWRVTDTSKVSTKDQDRALRLAASLDDYSAAWVDQSPNPAVGQDLPPEEEEQRLNDPRYTVINIAVTGDLDAAEKKLRGVWSGMLCVSRGERTEAELQAVQDQLGKVPGLVSIDPDARSGEVWVGVIHDDGSIQKALDKKFGKGLVLVQSALKPV